MMRREEIRQYYRQVREDLDPGGINAKVLRALAEFASLSAVESPSIEDARSLLHDIDELLRQVKDRETAKMLREVRAKVLELVERS
ncbi:hypothetical protein [Vulcanisaeta sp. JCM 16159]|uniref:hypothetical protein n=1 Tax=Vulcanisaeta sp. JCM 16159 TaxID=1295371 RepID=UPI0006D1DD80|nr:hypothetical protein [Vulcanisaeta sp. JCM 16159]